MPTPPPFHDRIALFLDFDGTLVGFQDDPDKVHLTPEQAQILKSISEELSGALAIITGRDVRDISTRVPTRFWRAGNHGAAIAGPEEFIDELPSAPDPIHSLAQAGLAMHTDFWLEDKGPILAIHTRQASQVADELHKKMLGTDVKAHGYKIERGRGVVELKPLTASKGAAIQQLMNQPAFKGRVPVFIGDDTTDEDGFTVVNEYPEGLSIKVGNGPTVAKSRLPDPDAVWAWLDPDGY